MEIGDEVSSQAQLLRRKVTKWECSQVMQTLILLADVSAKRYNVGVQDKSLTNLFVLA